MANRRNSRRYCLIRNIVERIGSSATYKLANFESMNVLKTINDNNDAFTSNSCKQFQLNCSYLLINLFVFLSVYARAYWDL